MPDCNARLDFNISQDAWEPVSYRDSDGEMLSWHAATVLPGGTDIFELYQAAGDGNVYQAERGDDDANVAISLTATSKRVSLGMVSLLHTLFLRAEAATDTISVQVTAGGAEYGEVSHTYERSLAGDGDKEIKVRLHRDLMGRWVEVSLGGDVSNRPSVREMRVRHVPVREGRFSA
jgi:hypothetical protein